MTTKTALLKSIRRKCLDCSAGGRKEVRECRLVTCALWPFRFGRDPSPSRGRGFGGAHRHEPPDGRGACLQRPERTTAAAAFPGER
jgi:hypothetical protein